MTHSTLAPQMAELCAECFSGCRQQIELGFFVPINLVVSASVSRVKCVLQTASVLWAVSNSTHLLFSVCRLLLELQRLCVERVLHSTAAGDV